ncbi:MAG: hypothetical protein A3K19_26210 [Lentisphaerae bacterium RIFOXYB12_FULL_65_16]|nr:MAG: hypothetical protein A3K18_29675 [Lentisphaerae bacterium RIFOXYA12_64_32]OGV87769.1 MAG: hypothetical protein A3K19_26210 [Lentisphaerae bacterium RIFOXYB12_FULL_65_16]
MPTALPQASPDPTALKNLRRLVLDSLAFEYLGGRAPNFCQPHLHDNRVLPFLVIVCPVDVEYYCKINGDGTHTVRIGEALLVPAGVPHGVQMKEAGAVDYAHIRYTVFENIDVISLFDLPPVVHGAAGRRICTCTKRLSALMNREGPLSFNEIVRTKAVAYRLLDAILAAGVLGTESFARMADMQRIAPALAYIRSHERDWIALTTLAEVLSLSPTRVHSLFMRVMQQAPMAYVKRHRLTRAQWLLIGTPRTISEIAAEVGYSSIFNFSRQFRKAFGESPSQYRAKGKAMLEFGIRPGPAARDA